MFAFITYELKVAVVLAAFYLCFKLILSRENLHRLNRVVLLCTAVLSFVLPLCIITLHKTVPMPEFVESGLVEEIAPSAETVSDAEESTSGWKIILVVAYWLGVIAVLSSIVIGIMRVVKQINSGERKELNGTEVIVCNNNLAPFSWMKWIVLCDEDYHSGNNHILEHEKAHIRLGHSKDVLLVDALSAFQWFNPAIWLLKRDLRAVHEYEADDAVLKSGADIKEYQYSLIRKAVSASGYSITNSFNHSILKNRMAMMSKSNASWMRCLKVAYIFPLIGGTLALNARTVIDYDISENLLADPSAKSFGSQIQIATPAVQTEGVIEDVAVIAYGPEKIVRKTVTTKEIPVDFSRLTKKPNFNGGDAGEFAKWVAMHLLYPDSARSAGVQGRVTVKFKVNSDGKISDVNVLRGICDALDQEAVRVVASAPDWTPGEADGKPVATTYTFPVIFNLR